MPDISAQKRSINAVCDEVLSRGTSSILSRVTIIQLRVGGFLPPTNSLQTILPGQNALNYKIAKLYAGSKKGEKPNLSKQWFVYYSYRNPVTKKLERQPPVYRDINTFNTIGERKEYAQALVILINDLLKAGFSPYEEFVNKEDGTLDKNILSCAKFYLSEKEKYLAPKSYKPYSQHVGYFVDWINETHLGHLDITQIKRFHIMKFLSDYRDRSIKYAVKNNSKPASNRQINNIKGNLSTFFNYFKINFEDEVPKNPVARLENLPHKTQGNKAYTDKQATLLKTLMQEHNPRMLRFCEMVYESCTRPHEETRLLKIADIEFEQNRIHIRPEISKEHRSEFIPMNAKYMDQLKDYIVGYPEDYYLFTTIRHSGANRYKKIAPIPLTPGKTPISEGTLRDWYKIIKNMAGLDETWSIYSWAHTYCVRAYLDTKDVYFIQMKKRHTLLSTTCNYLRGLGLFVDLNQIADNVRGI